MSAESGPLTFIPSLFNFLIAGNIIFFSSEFLLNSALCGFKPKTQNLGLLLKYLYQSLIVLTFLTILSAVIILETSFKFICVVIGQTDNFLFQLTLHKYHLLNRTCWLGIP